MKKKFLSYLFSLGILTMISACEKKELEPIKVIDTIPIKIEIMDELSIVDEGIIANLPELKVEELTDNIEDKTTSITISAVGDCTLGRDDKYAYPNSLPYVLEQQNNNYSYFFNGVFSILDSDDLTIANLESPLTDSETKASKKFTFKGPSEYTNILILWKQICKYLVFTGE